MAFEQLGHAEIDRTVRQKVNCDISVPGHMFHGLDVLLKVNNYVLIVQTNINALSQNFKNTPFGP
jgi:hypothetical protein